MESKKHTSPLIIMGLLFTLSSSILCYLVNILMLGNDEHVFFSVILSLIAVAFAVAGLILYVLNLVRQKKRKEIVTDEYTTKIIQKCGSICFVVFMLIVFVVFFVFQIICLSTRNFDGNINKLIDLKLLLSIVAFAQTACVFLFSLLFYIFSKAGEKQ